MAHKHPVVGILVDGVSSFGRGVLRGVTQYANLQRRWELRAELWPCHERTDALPKCDAVIIAGQPAPVLSWAIAHVRHVINCSGAGDPAQSPVVSLDNCAVGAMAAGHLLECGLERFAFFGSTTYRTAADRLRGFVAVLAEQGYQGIQSPAEIDYGRGYQLDQRRDEIATWVAGLPKPVGVLAYDDPTAYALAAAALEANISVPDRMAIIGVNDDTLICESAWPPLSSVDCGWIRVGHQAAVLVDDLLSGKHIPHEQREIRIPPLGVVQRQSTSLLAIEDQDLAEAIHYIRKHACAPCSVGDVLDHVPVGRRWLERHFMRTLGRTPHDEMMRVRIETAQRFLMRSTLALPEIARRCGFSKTSSLHVAFKRVTGQTPAVFRRSARSGGVATPSARPPHVSKGRGARVAKA